MAGEVPNKKFDYASAAIDGPVIDIEEYSAGLVLDLLRKGHVDFLNLFGRYPTLLIVGHEGWTALTRTAHYLARSTGGIHTKDWLEQYFGVRLLFDPDFTGFMVEWVALTPGMTMETTLDAAGEIAESRKYWRTE